MYTAKCDNCGTEYNDKHSGICAWNDTGYLQEIIHESGWQTIESKEFSDQHICPDCWEIGEDDEIKIKPILTENKNG